MGSNINESEIKKGLSKYQNQDTTKKQIISVLHQYFGLQFDSDSFVFNDGSRKNLCNLQGTIPVNYKGTSYNIPICIWVMDTHPNNAPMCYVKPTADMMIKVSKYVDHNGKIYLPYLHNWSPTTSDLLGLIQVMICVFGEFPPVFQKRKNDNSPKPYPTQQYLAGQMPTPYPSFPSFLQPCTNYPLAGDTPYPPSNLPYQNSSCTEYPLAGMTPYPPSSSSFPSNSSPSGPGYPVYPPTSGGNYPGYPPYPSNPVSPPTTNSSSHSGTITEEHIRDSLLSAVEDKLKRRLREQYSQAQAELETLHKTQQELLQGKAKLEDIVNRLEKEKVELEKNIEILKEKDEELEKSVERLSEEKAIDVDEAVTTTTPLYNQLLNSFAEEAAIEDAIYYIGEALRKGVIDLDVFLKHVRSLSRQQFMLRALMQKCRQKAGLAG